LRDRRRWSSSRRILVRKTGLLTVAGRSRPREGRSARTRIHPSGRRQVSHLWDVMRTMGHQDVRPAVRNPRQCSAPANLNKVHRFNGVLTPRALLCPTTDHPEFSLDGRGAVPGLGAARRSSSTSREDVTPRRRSAARLDASPASAAARPLPGHR
jgi:hypothetical protein